MSNRLDYPHAEIEEAKEERDDGFTTDAEEQEAKRQAEEEGEKNFIKECTEQVRADLIKPFTFNCKILEKGRLNFGDEDGLSLTREVARLLEKELRVPFEISWGTIYGKNCKLSRERIQSVIAEHTQQLVTLIETQIIQDIRSGAAHFFQIASDTWVNPREITSSIPEQITTQVRSDFKARVSGLFRSSSDHPERRPTISMSTEQQERYKQVLVGMIKEELKKREISEQIIKQNDKEIEREAQRILDDHWFFTGEDFPPSSQQ